MVIIQLIINKTHTGDIFGAIKDNDTCFYAMEPLYRVCCDGFCCCWKNVPTISIIGIFII